MRQQPSPPNRAEVEALYPFLYAGSSDLPAVLAQVRASTVAKAAEITQLREAVAAFGTSKDIAVGLSTSGNSENLVRGFEEASRAQSAKSEGMSHVPRHTR